MTNKTEARRALSDAENELDTATFALKHGKFTAAVQNAELCIEHSAKAIISHFAEPEWTHNPASQLLGILEKNKDLIAEFCGEDMPEQLTKLAESCNSAAPWHGRSTYGGKLDDGTWISAKDSCTHGVAESLVGQAKEAYAAASRFFRKYVVAQ